MQLHFSQDCNSLNRNSYIVLYSSYILIYVNDQTTDGLNKNHWLVNEAHTRKSTMTSVSIIIYLLTLVFCHFLIVLYISTKYLVNVGWSKVNSYKCIANTFNIVDVFALFCMKREMSWLSRLYNDCIYMAV